MCRGDTDMTPERLAAGGTTKKRTDPHPDPLPKTGEGERPSPRPSPEDGRGRSGPLSRLRERVRVRAREAGSYRFERGTGGGFDGDAAGVPAFASRKARASIWIGSPLGASCDARRANMTARSVSPR